MPLSVKRHFHHSRANAAITRKQRDNEIRHGVTLRNATAPFRRNVGRSFPRGENENKRNEVQRTNVDFYRNFLGTEIAFFLWLNSLDQPRAYNIAHT